MTNEQHEYEMNCAGQAQAEYEQQMAYYEYLDGLIESKQYQLHAIEIVIDMLNSKRFIESKMTDKDFLFLVKSELLCKTSTIKESDGKIDVVDNSLPF